MRAAVLVVAATASADDAPWKFLASYPAQLDALADMIVRVFLPGDISTDAK